MGHPDKATVQTNAVVTEFSFFLEDFYAGFKHEHMQRLSEVYDTPRQVDNASRTAQLEFFYSGSLLQTITIKFAKEEFGKLRWQSDHTVDDGEGNPLPEMSDDQFRDFRYALKRELRLFLRRV